jgi:energy-coupling factor transporter ATP-binding protein EcfA2
VARKVNRAGKSTLLKALSRITEPTGGRVLLRGRVASLLEVGTGFHPELTAAKTSFLMVRLLGRPTHEEPLRWLFPRGRPAMTMFAGLDVRFKRTAICVDG